MKRLLFLLTTVFLGFALNAQINTFPYAESWETSGSFGSWTNVTTDTEDWVNQTGSTGSSGTGPTAASDSLRYLYVETSGSSAGDQAFLENTFDISNLTDPELKFDYHMYFNGAANGGRLAVDVSTDNGNSWCNVWALQGDQGNQWHTDEIVSLKGYGFDTIMVRFNFIVGTNTSFQNDAAIDDFELRSAASAPTCPKPICVQAYNIGSTTATLSWEPLSIASNGYDVIYGTSGFDPATGGTTVNSSTDTIGLTGLSTATVYDAYVIAKCGGTNGSSDTAGPVSFETSCATFTAPYTMNFDSETDGQLATCWSQWNSYNNFAYARVETNPFGITPASGSNVLEMYSYFQFTTSDTLAAVSPQFTDMTAGDKQIEFKAATGDVINEIYVGTTNSAAPGSPIDYIDTISFATTGTFQTVRVNLDSANGYNGTDQFIVLEHSKGGTFDDIWIDDFKYQIIPACPDPFLFQLTSVTDTSGTISFSHPDTSFQFNWGPCGFTQGSPTSNFVNGGNPFTAANLTPNTCYDIYVKADCSASGNGTSGWAGPFSFRTNCAPFTAPYSQNFDATTSPELDNCWTPYVVGTTAAVETDDRTSGTSPRSTPNQLFLDNGSNTTNDTTAAISPRFSDMTSGDKRVRFWTAAEFISNSVDLWVGTMSNPRDGSTISILDTIVIQGNNNYFEVSVNLDSANGYNGIDEYVVLMHDNSTGFDGIMVDDFVYEDIPSCTGPITAQSGVSSVTATGANVFWNGGIGDTTKIIWGSPGFDPATSRIGQAFAAGVDTTFTISGLTAQTSYDVYLQDSCNASGAGVFIGPFSFTTACLPVMAPFTEDFDNTSNWSGTTIDPCWSSSNSSGHTWQANSGTTPSSNTGPDSDNTTGSDQYLYTETSSTSPATTTLFSPLIDVSNLNVPFVSFFYHRFGATMGTLKVEINDGTGWQTIITLVGPDQTASSDPWKETGADVSAFGDTIQLRFESTRGSSFTGDGAIDDFSVVEAPACPDVAGLNAKNITDSSAVLNWVGTSNANDYQVWFGRAGFFQGTQTAGGTKVFTGSALQDSLVLDTLIDNTCYEFLVRGICGPGDTSDWVGAFSFCTPCIPFTAPYTQDFDATTAPAVDACWSDYIVGTTAAVVTNDQTFGTTPRSTPNQLLIDNGSNTTNDTTVAISPPFSDMVMGDKRVRFWTAAEFNTNLVDLWVGTMSDPTDDSTISILDTIVIQGNNSYFEAIVNLDSANGYNGTDQHVVLMHDNSNGFDGIMVDDFNYEAIPSCPKPSDFRVDIITSDSVFLSWNPSGSSNNNFLIEYGRSTTLGDSSNLTVSVNGSNGVIGGLVADANYCFWIRDVCSAGDTSAWTTQICAKTACAPFSAPYAENFDGVATGISGDFSNCWEAVGGTTSNYSWRSNTGTTGSASTGPSGDATTGSGVYLYTEASSGASGDTAALLSPIIDISSLTSAELRYAYHTYGSNIDTILVEIFDGNSWNLESKIGEEMSDETDPWKVDTVDLSSYSGSIRVRYRLRSNGCCSGDAAIDDFIIEEPVNSDLSLVSANFSKSSLCLSSNDTLIYEVANIKGGTYDLSTNPLVLNYDVSGPINSTGNATFNTGTINAGDTSSFLITGIDLSSPGSYALLQAKMDANNFNLSPLNDSIDNAANLLVREVWDVDPDTVVLINNTTDSATLTVNSSLLGGQLDSVMTTPPLTANNGSGGVTFEIEAQRNVDITALTNIFTTGETSANLWMRTGGVLHASGSAPDITAANGWTQVITNAPVTGANSTNSVRMDFGGITIPLQANQRYGFFIEANTRYQTGTAADQTIYSDGTITVNVSDSIAYGGGAPSPTFNPRRFLGGVIYEKPSSTPGFNWTLNGNVIDTLPELVVGPYTSSGVFNYVATLNNSPCGSFTDTVTVIVNLSNSCPTPTGLASANVGCDSIELSWNSNTGGSILQWGPQGFTPGTGNFTGVVTSSWTATGLTPNTAYDFWVADTCGSDTSAFAGPVSVTTANGPQPVAQITVVGDTILGGSKLFLLDGSGSSDADSYQWDFGNGQTSNNAVDTASYAVSGSFTITLIVTNACGSDTATVSVLSDVSLDENPLGRSLSLFPNPTDGQVTIAFDASAGSDAAIRIMDMQGRVVMVQQDQKVNGNYRESFDLSNLAKGVYMVEIQSGDLRAVRRLTIR